MSVTITWGVIKWADDPRWANNYGLYAYLTPDRREVQYIGKVDGCTATQRGNAPDNMAFWRYLESKGHIFEHVHIFHDVDTLFLFLC